VEDGDDTVAIVLRSAADLALEVFENCGEEQAKMGEIILRLRRIAARRHAALRRLCMRRPLMSELIET
jgi:hypothetical protein